MTGRVKAVLLAAIVIVAALVIEENGTTVLLWFIPGSFCCGIGSFVAYHIQMKNLNKMARAYNGKMFAQNRTNV